MSNLWNNDYNPFQKWKVLAWRENLEGIKRNNFLAPVNIALDIIQGTNDKKSCNGFKCNFCMSDLEDKGVKAKIDEELLLSMPVFFADWGVKSLCIAGHHSDPLTYKNSILRKFLQLCHYYGIDVGLVSNGVGYTKAMLENVAMTCTWSGWSINAGTAETHEKITGSKKFNRIIDNIIDMADFKKRHNLNHAIGYKYLITDDNYNEIIDGVKLARRIGINHFQIRPTELPLERSKKIDIKLVEEQIKEALTLEVENEFEVFGIREKFTPEFTKKTPNRCIASPLGSTWKADGDIVICPDRRWSADYLKLGNFKEEGLQGIKHVWGSKDHLDMIKQVNEQCELDKCIRCTSFSWHEIYENCIEQDKLNITLI